MSTQVERTPPEPDAGNEQKPAPAPDGRLLTDSPGVVQEASERKRVLQEMDTQVHFYQSVIEHAPVGIAVFDGRELRFKWANPTYQQFLEEPHRSGAIVGRLFQEIVPRAEESGLVKLFRQVASTGRPYVDTDYCHTGFARGITYWRWSLMPLPESGGDVPDLLLLVTEITEQVLARKQAEALAAALAQERDTLNAIMEHTHASLAFLDVQFTFLRVNAVYAESSGYRKEELLGRNHFDLFPNAENQAVFERVRDTGQAAVFLAKPFAFPDRPELGITYWDWTLTPVKDVQGCVRGLVLSLLDVTAVEVAHQEHEARLSALDTLVSVSKQVLAEHSRQGILQHVTEGARALTAARLGVAGHGYRDGRFEVGAVARAEGAPDCPPGEQFSIRQGGVYLDLIQSQTSLRLDAEQLQQHPAWWGLPAGHAPLRGLLGARLTGSDGLAHGLIMVSDKVEGDFTPEDEAGLTQLAAIASLGLQQLAARHEAEHRSDELNTVFEALTDAVVVCDPAGITLRANPAACALCGPDVLRLDRAALARELDFHHPDGRLYSRDELPVYRALAGETVAEACIILTDPKGEQRIVLTSAAPLLAHGHLEGAVTVWHDVTERQTTTAQLEAERARLGAIIQNAPEGIIVTDEVARVVLANPAAERICARPIPYHQELVSPGGLMLYYPDGRPVVPRDSPLTRAALDGEMDRNVEMALQWPDGQQRMLLVNAAPIRDPEDKLAGAVGILQDITRRKRVDRVLRRYIRDLRLLNHAGRDLSASFDTQQVLDGVLEAVQRLVTVMGACIWLWSEEHPGWLVCRAGTTCGWGPALLQTRVRADESVLGQVVQRDRSLILSTANDAVRRLVPSEDWLGACAGSLMLVPLRSRDKVIGVLVAASRAQSSFKPYDRSLLETLSSAAAIAIENARLHDQAQRSAVAAERSRLARELHDAVSQTLFSASVIAETLPLLWERDPAQAKSGLAQLRQLTRGALAEMRSLLLELRPSALLETDLGELLKQLTAAVAGRSRITTALELDSPRHLPPEVHIALYRIAQEALHNVIKHARATRVVVSLQYADTDVTLAIRDDGRGFDPNQVSPEHLGLGIMRERAQALEMTFSLTTEVGHGTAIVVHWSGGNRREAPE